MRGTKISALTIIVQIVALLSIAMVVGAVDMVEIRGQVATGNFEWNAQNFAGFYYDIKDDIGTETLSTTLTSDKKLSGDSNPGYGVKYMTNVQPKEFKFEDWGAFKVMGFLADRYFAGYVENKDNAEKSILFKESTDENSLSREQLQKILIDDDTEKTVTSGTSLKLGEGYELAIKSIDIDGNKVYLDLSKDGAVLDSKVITPSKTDASMADRTYYYKNPAVGDQKKLVTIAVHFKNAFRGADQNLATVDGLWQISGEATDVKADTQYDKMTITSVDANAGTITMENKDNAITLSKNKHIALMSGISIRTADNETLRYYIYRKITEPGTYELRGAVATADSSWNAQNFAGFYYDIKDDIGTETLSTTLTDKKLSGDSPYGVKYVTTAKSKEFKFEDWGAFNVMGFLADRYFAGYVENKDNAEKNLLFKESTDENSLSREQLQKVLIDDDTEKSVTSGTPLKLEEGYELAIKSIDIDGNKVSLELFKDGAVVDRKVISPSKTDATMADKTYYYKNPAVGDQKKLVTIAVHFKNAFRGSDQNLATVDGIWQISSEATDVKAETQYDKLTITSVDANAGTITMENKDNAITLSKNKDTALMSGISIKTADNNTLRYYIYKAVTIEGAAAHAAEAAPVVEAAPAVEAAKENVTQAEAVETAATESIAKAKTAEKAAEKSVAEAVAVEKTATESVAEAKAAETAATESVAEAKAAETAATESVAEAVAVETAATESVAEAVAVETAATESLAKAKAAEKAADARKAIIGKGQIADDISNLMNVSQVYTVTAYITKDLTENITQQFTWERKPTVGVTKVIDKMMVTLNGRSDDFTIVPFGETIQNLSVEGNATWQWHVTPLKAGNKKLSLVANLVFSNGETKLYRAYDRNVEVKINEESFLVWLQANWKWVASSLAAAIAAIIGFFKWLYPLIKPRLKSKEQ